MAAFLQSNAIVEFVKKIPEMMSAAKDNPLGVVIGIIAMVALVVVVLLRNDESKAKLMGVGAVFVIALVGFFYVGSMELGKRPGTGAGITISGKVIDSKTGRPVVRAKVSLATQGVPATTSTNTDGFWVVDNFKVPPGSHVKVSVDAQGYQSAEKDLDAEAVLHPPEILLDPVDAPVVPKPVPGPGMVTLAGTIYAHGRVPIEGAVVLLESSGSPPQQERTTTDRDGGFSLADIRLRPDMKITVRAAGYKTATQNITRSSAARRIEIQLEKD